jgi:hypothetical protein
VSCPQISAKTPLVFHPTADDVYAANLIPLGIGTRTVSSATVSASPTGLTFASITGNSSAITGEYGQTVAIGKAVQFRMTGGTAATDYVITGLATLSDGKVLPFVLRGECRSS